MMTIQSIKRKKKASGNLELRAWVLDFQYFQILNPL